MQPIKHQSKINLVLFTAYNKDDFATEHLWSGLSGLLSLSVIFSCVLIPSFLQLLLSSPQNLLGCLNVSPCNLELLSQMGELRVLIDILILDKYTDNVPTSLMPLKLAASQ